MGYSKKELKFHIKYIKKALRLINKVEKSIYGLSLTYMKLKEDLEKELVYYKDQLRRNA